MGPNDRAKPKGQVFLGRGREVDDVSALMADWPLVTVVGPGGIGKTALAGQVAQRVAEDAGVAFAWCDLARLSPNDDVGASVSAWLGFSGLDALVEAHHNQEALIVLDNCEHVLDSAARTAERLVATGPLRIIATSRERLDLAHERVFALTPLSAEASIELMRTRADQVGASVQDFSDDALGRLCAQLDHLPLAIELAAARLRMLSPAELAGHLAGRLDLLTGGRSLPDRHRSLRAAIDWSYALLDPQGQRWFARLGIFDGPFSLEDAAAVCAEPSEDNVAVAHALERLVNVSLLVTVPRVRRDQGMEHTRYRLLESLRHFAQERLGARDELGPMRDRRVAHIVSVAGEILQAGMNAWDADVTERLFTSIDALCWATDVCIRIDDAPDRAIVAYLPSWGVVHHSHAARLADLGDAFLDKWPPDVCPGAADVAMVCATAHLRLAHVGRAELLCHAALQAAAPGMVAPVGARRVLALIAQHRGDLEAALVWTDESLEVCAGLGLAPFVPELRANRGVLLGQLGRLDEALAAAHQALEDCTKQESMVIRPWITATVGRLTLERDPVAARRWLEEALQLHVRLHDGFTTDSTGLVRQSLAIVAFRQGALSEAGDWLRQALEHFRSVDDQIEVWNTIRWIGVWLSGADRLDDAATVLAAAVSHPATPAETALESEDLRAALRAIDGRSPRPMSAREVIELAMDGVRAGPAVRATPTNDDVSVKPTGRILREGEGWRLDWQGQTCRLRDAKGLHDLRTLLTRPGEDVHCLVLMGAAVEQSDLGPTLDAQARQALQVRIRDLQEDLAEAEANNDLGRAERCQSELDALVEALAQAVGLGGRDRAAGATAERARSAVTWRLRASVKRITKIHAALGHHLKHAVKTGVFCRYDPERPVEWAE